jgi:hypothetical protein
MKKDPNYQRLHELYEEFAATTEKLHTFYLDSIAGYSILHKRLSDKQERVAEIFGNEGYTSVEHQDKCSVLYKELCEIDLTPHCRWGNMKQGDVKKRVRENGDNVLLLGNQCVVSAYTYWDEYLRIEIGKAIGVLPDNAKNDDETKEILRLHVTEDFWGDMRLLRRSILHNKGIAIPEIIQCKIFKWFKPWCQN